MRLKIFLRLKIGIQILTHLHEEMHNIIPRFEIYINELGLKMQGTLMVSKILVKLNSYYKNKGRLRKRQKNFILSSPT